MGSLEGMKIQLDGIAHVLADNRLSVPRYQRSYAWETKNITDLFNDLADAIRQNVKEYFLGSIVITGTLKDRLEVVDGQQRLATTSILLAAIRDYFYINGDRDRAEDISSSFLMHRNLRDQEKVPKLFLNDIDRDFYSKRILANPGDSRRNIASLKESHKRLENAARLAAERVNSLTSQTKNPTGILVDWIEYLLTKASVICVTVPDDANAFTIFETLNDRGLDLAVSDLLKNYLFSLAQDRLEEVQQKWLLMTGILEAVANEEILVTYMRHFWSSSNGPTREKALYGGIKQRITSKQSVIDFAEDLYRNSSLYAAILNPSQELWDTYGPTTREYMSTLNLLGMEQMRPLIMAVLDNFTPVEVRLSLKMMVSWGVRFLIVGGFFGGGMGDFYSQKAVEIRKGIRTTTKSLMESMQSVVPTDKEFLSSFEIATVTKSNLARYYLRVLEQQARNDPEPAFIANPNQDQVNLEHILPQNPSAAWSYLDAETARTYYNRIGNLALLQKRPNTAAGNAGFSQKLPYYKKSEFTLTSSIEKYTVWGVEQIEERQKEIAQLAVKAWPNKV